MRYIGTLTATALRRMGHKNKSFEELTVLARRINAVELRAMRNTLRSFKERNGKTNKA